MENVRINKEMHVCSVILSMERPFKVSQLFERMVEEGITDKDFVLEILDQLCDSGLIRYSEINNDMWAYKKTMRYQAQPA